MAGLSDKLILQNIFDASATTALKKIGELRTGKKIDPPTVEGEFDDLAGKQALENIAKVRGRVPQTKIPEVPTDIPDPLSDVAENVLKAPWKLVEKKPEKPWENEAYIQYVEGVRNEMLGQTDVVRRSLEVAKQEQDIEGIKQAQDTLNRIESQAKSKIQLARFEEMKANRVGRDADIDSLANKLLGGAKSIFDPVWKGGLKGLMKLAKGLDTIDLGPQRRKLFAMLLGLEKADILDLEAQFQKGAHPTRTPHTHPYAAQFLIDASEEYKFGDKWFGDLVLDKLKRDNPDWMASGPDIGGQKIPFTDKKLPEAPLNSILAAFLGLSGDVAEILTSPSTWVSFGIGRGLKAGGQVAAKRVIKAEARGMLKGQLQLEKQIAKKTGDLTEVLRTEKKIASLVKKEKRLREIQKQIKKNKATDDVLREHDILSQQLQETVDIPIKVNQFTLSKQGEPIYIDLIGKKGIEEADRLIEAMAKQNPALRDLGGIKFNWFGLGKQSQVLTGDQIRRAVKRIDRGIDSAVNKATRGVVGKPFPKAIDEIAGRLPGETKEALRARKMAEQVEARTAIEGEAALEGFSKKGPRTKTVEAVNPDGSRKFTLDQELSGEALGQFSDRAPLHRKILERTTPKDPIKEPVLDVYMGSAGAGKSEAQQILIPGDAKGKYFEANPDAYKSYISEYDPNLPQYVHDESSLLSTAQLGKGLDDGVATVFESTGHSAPKMNEVLSKAKQKGSKTRLSYMDQSEAQLETIWRRRKANGDRLPPLDISKDKRIKGLEAIKDVWRSPDEFALFSKDDTLHQRALLLKLNREIRYVKGKEKDIERLLGKGWRKGHKVRAVEQEADLLAGLRRMAGRVDGSRKASARASGLARALDQAEPGMVGERLNEIGATMRGIFKRDLSSHPSYAPLKQGILYDQVSSDKKDLLRYLTQKFSSLKPSERRLVTWALEETPIAELPRDLRAVAKKVVTDGDVLKFEALPTHMQQAINAADDISRYWGAVEQGEGILKEIIENYAHHAYKDLPDKVIEKLITYRQQGFTPGFAKQRVIPTLAEAYQLGLTPVDDIAELMMIRGMAHSNARRSRQFVKSVKNVFEKEGYIIPEKAADDIGRQLMIEGSQTPAVKQADDIITIDRIVPEYDVKTGLPKVAGLEMIEVQTKSGRKRIMPFRELPENVARKPANEIKSEVIKDLKHRVSMVEIQKDLDRIQTAFVSDPHFKKLGKTYDKVLNLYKGYLTSPFPAFHARNFISNVVQNSMNIGLDAINPKRNLQANMVLSHFIADELAERGGRWAAMGKRLKDASAGALKTRTGQVYTYEELAQIAKGMDVITGDLLKADFTKTAAQELETSLANAIQRGLIGKGARAVNVFSNESLLLKYGRKFGSGIENQARLTNFVSHVRQGRSFQEAAAMVKKTLFDYGNLSPIERSVFRRIFPFYTWTRKNIELQAELFARYPGAYSSIYRIANRMKNRANLTEKEEDAVLGEIAKIGFVIPVGRKGEEVTAVSGFGIPQETMVQFTSEFRKGIVPGSKGVARQIMLQSLPGTMFAKLATGVDPFTQAPVGRMSRVPTAFKYLPKSIQESIDLQPHINREGNGVFYTANPEIVEILRSLPASRFLSFLQKVDKWSTEDKLYVASMLSGVRIRKINVAKEMFRSLRRDLSRKGAEIRLQKKDILRERIHGPTEQVEEQMPGPGQRLRELFGGVPQIP